MRTTTRLAARNLRRSKGLYLTIALLIALPVAIGVTAAIALRSSLTDESALQQRYGSSEFVLDVSYPGLELAPAGASDTDSETGDATIKALTRDLEAEGGEVLVRRELYVSGPVALQLVELNYDSPLAQPILRSLEGRLPTRPGEVVLARRVLEQHEVMIGDRLPTSGDNSVLVVGSIEPGNVWEDIGFVAPGTLSLSTPSDPFTSASLGISGLGADEIATIAKRHLSDHQYVSPWSTETDFSTYYETIDPGGRPEQAGTLIAGALLVEAALLAGAAFAIGARRRVTEFGRLSAIGADGKQITAMMVAEGALVSLAGAVAGAAAALVFTFGSGRWFEATATWVGGTRPSGVEIHPLDVAGPVAVAVVAGVIACWWPAKRASQLSAVTALAAGSRRQAVPRWLIPASFGVLALSLLANGLASDTSFNGDGGVTTLLAIATVISLAVAIVGFSTSIVGTMATKGATALPMLLRLAVRESARHRQRTVAALSGAAFLLTGFVFAMTMIISNIVPSTVTSDDPATMVVVPKEDVIGWLDLGDPTAERPEPRLAVPEATSFSVDISGTNFGPFPIEEPLVFFEYAELDQGQSGVFSSSTSAMVANDQLLDVLAVPTELRQELATPGRGLYLGTAPQFGGQFTVATITEDAIGPSAPPLEQRRTIDATAFPVPALAHTNLLLLIGPATVEAFALPAPTSSDFLVSADGFDNSELEALERLGAWTPLVNDRDGEPQTWFQTVVVPQLIALAVLAVILAIIYRIIGGLVAVETERDLATMVSIGAPQRIRRRQLGAQVFVSVALAVAVALPLGVLTAVVTNETGWQPVAIEIPWVFVAGLSLLPILIGAVIAATIRDAPPAMSRRLA